MGRPSKTNSAVPPANNKVAKRKRISKLDPSMELNMGTVPPATLEAQASSSELEQSPKAFPTIVPQHYLFVYGSLMSGRPFNSAISHLEKEGDRVFLPFFTTGTHKHGNYNAIIPSNLSMVEGELYKLPVELDKLEKMLDICDRIEGSANNLYHRVQLPVVIQSDTENTGSNFGITLAFVYVTPDYKTEVPVFNFNELPHYTGL